jgi:hypothetical protein
MNMVAVSNVCPMTILTTIVGGELSLQDKVGVKDPPTEKLVGFYVRNRPRCVGERERTTS